MNNFRAIDRESGFLLPPSVDDWLPKKHLARFVVEVMEPREHGMEHQADVRPQSRLIRPARVPPAKKKRP
jgi:hypothetical protein